MDAELLPIQGDIRAIHHCLKQQMPGIDRIAAALYDARTDTLRTFAHSTDGSALERYEAHLQDVPSLQRLADSRESRVLGDLASLQGSHTTHTRFLLDNGYRSSFTQPFYEGGTLLGILFLDSRQPDYFTSRSEWLSSVANLMGTALAHRLAPARMLEAAVRVVSRLTHYRDPETRSHLDRMAHYAHLIGRALAERDDLTDEYLELLLEFAPMHDVGKVAVPDRILRKAGRLTGDELEVMKSHVARGGEIVDGILADIGLQDQPHVSILRNVVLYHHEAVDGSGYPHGLRGVSIPLESRIVTVADVYDALTSRRPYKEAWPQEDALAYLMQGAGTRFDWACVEALSAHAGEAAAIRARFTDRGDDDQSREGYTADL